MSGYWRGLGPGFMKGEGILRRINVKMRFQDRKLSLFVLDWNMENRGDSVKTSSGNVLTRQCIIYCAAAPVRDVNCEEGKLFIVTNQ